MSDAAAPRPLYLDVDGEQAYAVLHASGAEASRDTALLFCPPFGWEEVCSHRVLRAWATELAAHGYPALRLTFPGTGDSGGGPHDPGRIDAWTNAVGGAARWVRAATGVDAVVAVGLGLGGLIAYRAAAGDGAVDGLVLWAASARGSDVVRHLRAFSRLERAQFYEGLAAPPPPAAEELEAGGFTLSQETLADLADLDLTKVRMRSGLRRGALLLRRDGIEVDVRIREALERDDAAVTVADGDGYAEMTSHPQQSQLPVAVITAVTRWLDGCSGRLQRAGEPAASVGALPAGASDHMTVDRAGRGWTETPVTIEQPVGLLSAVLTEPIGESAPVGALFLNAGAGRRIGPNRMWVEAARRWAARGVPSLRLDIQGIGESDGETNPYQQDGSLYVPELVPQVLEAVDFLRTRGVARRFILIGLCSGAYWAFHAMLDDPHVTATAMLNPRALIWDEGLAPSRDLRRVFTDRSWSRLRKNATPERLRAVMLWLAGTPVRWWRRLAHGAELTTDAQVDVALDRLRTSNKRALMLFSGREPLMEDLTRSGRLGELESWPNVTVARIAVKDHTLRPGWAQRETAALLDGALERELGRTAEPVAEAT